MGATGDATTVGRAAPPGNARVADHYDELDRFYREIWGEHVHHGLWLTGFEPPSVAAEQLVHFAAGRADIVPGDRVCDVGCGYGGTARLLAREYGASVVGITLSRVQFEYAVACTPEPGVRFVHGDWLRNDLPDAAFDVALFVESTDHIADRPRSFAEARRVLKPGGRLVVCAWLASPHATRWQVRGLLEPICREGRLPPLPTAEGYRRWIEGAGFAGLHVEQLAPRVKRTWSICIARAARLLLRRPDYRAYLRSRASRNRAFALTLLRIWLAYETGAMAYGLFAARREGTSRARSANLEDRVDLDRHAEG